MVESLDLLVSNRRSCGISEENPYVFATPGGNSYLDPWFTLNKFAQKAGCHKPHLISSSRLRKYLSTVTQIMNLEDHELQWLSRHLAHDINTHKQYYRQHDAAIEIAKVGSLILAADKGILGRFAAKKLSQIGRNILSFT